MILVEQGDVVEVLRGYASDSFDACLCDPPYGLAFMGKAWDYDVPPSFLWREVLRVLKPGAPLIAFFGTRTYHRGVVRIEDGGFEIRDQLAWMHGQGFPKNLDVSKALDKARNEDDAAVRAVCRFLRAAMLRRGVTAQWLRLKQMLKLGPFMDGRAPRAARRPRHSSTRTAAGRRRVAASGTCAGMRTSTRR